jgi:hypothetical protein
VRTDLAAFLVSLTAISVACSGSSSPPGGLNNAGSSGGGTSSSGASGASSSNGGGASDDGGPGGSSSSSGSSNGSSGGPSSSSSSSSSGSGSSGTDGSTTTASYPSGPYCTAAGSSGHLPVGCVLPNTSWIGYDDEAANALATTEPYAAYSLGTAFADAQKSGKRYAMLNLAEFECPGCNKSAVELSTVGDGGVSAGAAVVQAGGVVIELLETAGFVDIATQTDLETWINDPTATGGAHALHVTTVEDPGATGTPSPSLAFFGQREQAYIIDLTTMKILQYIDGDITGIGATSGGLAMTAMHQLLGK